MKKTKRLQKMTHDQYKTLYEQKKKEKEKENN